MTYWCSECVVNWWPYQAREGRCPECGGGTVRSHDIACADADSRFVAAMNKRRTREQEEHERQLRRDDERRLAAERLAVVEALFALPTVDPPDEHGDCDVAA